MSFWNSERVSRRWRWSGPSAVAVMNGRLIVGLRDLGELDLRLLGRFLEPLHGHAVLREVDPVVVFEALDEPVHDRLVAVVAAEVGVARGRLDLEDALADVEDRDVEGASAEVEDEDRVVVGLVEPVGERRRRRLVDDAEDVEPGDLARLLRRLALRVVEVGGDGDDGVRHRVPEVGLGVPLELHEDAGGDLLGGVLLAVDLDGPVGPHVPLDRTDRPVGVRDRLALGDLSDENLALFEGDDRRGRSRPLGVGDDSRLTSVKGGDDAVRRAEIDSDRACHVCLSSLIVFLPGRPVHG